MIVHRPWVGKKYYGGFGSGSQRLAIVGHSHYWENDHDGVTIEVVESNAIDRGDQPFFNKIAGYFGYTNRI